MEQRGITKISPSKSSKDFNFGQSSNSTAQINKEFSIISKQRVINQAAFGSKSSRGMELNKQFQSPGPNLQTSIVKQSQNQTIFSKKQNGFDHHNHLSIDERSQSQKELENMRSQNVKSSLGQRPQTVKMTNIPGSVIYDKGEIIKTPSTNTKEKRFVEQTKQQFQNNGQSSYDPKEFLSKDKSPQIDFGKVKSQGNSNQKSGQVQYNIPPNSQGVNQTTKSKQQEKQISTSGQGTNITNSNYSNQMAKSQKKEQQLLFSKSSSNLKSSDQSKKSQKINDRKQIDQQIQQNISLQKKQDAPLQSMVSPILKKDLHRDNNNLIQIPVNSSQSSELGNNQIGIKKDSINMQELAKKQEFQKHKYSQGTGKKQNIVSKDILQSPGAGNYSFDAATFGKNGVQFQKSQNDQKKQKGPNTSSRNLSQVKEQSITQKISSTSKRLDLTKKTQLQSPNEDNYVENKDNTKSYTFLRIKDEKSQSPLPGSQDRVIKEKVISYEMGRSGSKNALLLQDKLGSPGPGYYDAQGKTIGKDSFMAKIIGKPKDTNNSESPGPGYYKQNYDVVKDRVITYDMGKPNNQEKSYNPLRNKSDSPGPGHYETEYKSFGLDSQKATIQGRPNDIIKNNSPGPSYYQQNYDVIKDRIISYDMGKASNQERQYTFLRNKSGSPGPGEYDTQYKSFGNDSQVTTIKGRPRDNSNNNSPGPGTYQVNHDVIKDRVITYDIGKSQQKTTNVEFKDKSGDIGPGSYDVNIKQIGKHSQQATIKGRPKDISPNLTTGPGTYRADYNIIKDRIVTYDMGKSPPRQTINNSKDKTSSPGPGYYETNYKSIGKDSQRAEIRGKYQDQRLSNSPGPGHYQQNYDIIKDRVITYDMGRSGSQEKQYTFLRNKSGSPGPGQYDNQSKSIGKDSFQAIINGRPREQSNNNSPGPGIYQSKFEVVKDRVVTFDMGKSSQKNTFSKSQDLSTPGPGQYETGYKQIGKDSQKISIQGKQRDQNKNNSPGPGQYQENYNIVKDRVVTYDMGKSQVKRTFAEQQESAGSPGPGQYDSYHKQIGKDSKMAQIRGRPKDQSNNDSPGPGHYQANHDAIKDKVISYDMGQSPQKQTYSQSNERNNIPGPGFYDADHNQIGKKSKGATIQGKPKDLKKNDIPGPGYYEANHNAIKDKIVTYDMGRSPGKRNFAELKDSIGSPGPGYYELDHKKIGKNSQMVQIQGRPKSQSNNDSPGPGYYQANHDAIKDKVISYDMGRSSPKKTFMDNQDKNSSPGPCSYEQEHKIIGKDSQKVSIRGRPKDQREYANPGPGYYEPNKNVVKNKVVGYDMGKSSGKKSIVESKDKANSLGPGSYDTQHKKIGVDSQKISIQGSSQEQNSNNNPGPGYYQANHNAVKDKVITYDMGKASGKKSYMDQIDKSGSPGPGHYDNDQKKIGNVSIRGRPNEQRANLSPGPGHYEANVNAVKDKVITYDMGKSPPKKSFSQSQERFDNPGPGHYDQNHKAFGRDSQQMSIRGRPNEQRANLSPGPGSYEANVNAIKDKVITYDMGKSPVKKSFIDNNDRNNSPGPGFYDSNHKMIGSNSQKMTIREKPKDQSSNNNPGPGSYEANVNAIKDKVVTYDMGKSPIKKSFIDNNDRNNSPGPGFYDSNHKKIGSDSQKAIIKGRPRDQNLNDNPGPGYYQANINAVKDKVVSYDMGKSPGKRAFTDSPERNQSPGPGFYDNDYKKIGTDSQKITIKGRPKDQRENDNLGPGHYNVNINNIKDKIISYDMGKSPTKKTFMDKNYRDQSPGPGFYESDYKKIGTDNKKMTIGGKPRDKSENINPGPGYYQSNVDYVKDKIVSYDMGKSPDRIKHNESLDKSQNIGPGTYNNDYKKIGSDSQKITIRGRPKDQNSNDNPGPGYYEANINTLKDKIVSYDMGKSPGKRTFSESPDRNQNIGPGTYDNDHKKIGSDSQKITIRGRPKDQSSNDNPGPGYYEANINTVKDKIVSYDMGKSPGKRTFSESPDRNQNIGPGTYDNDHKKIGSDSQKITIRGRPKDQSSNDNPGPGYYEANINTVKDKIVSYDMGKSPGKRTLSESPDRNQNIGPGTYDNDHKKIGSDSQKITLRGRPKDISSNDNPGPGYYEANINIVKDKIVSYDMGKSPDRITHNESPDRSQNIGPGTYDNDYKKIGTDTQKITIRGRPKDQISNDNPGPGYYEANVNAVKDKIVSYDMGRSPDRRTHNESPDRNQNIGPGSYNNDYKKIGIDTQKITIRGRPKDQSQNNNPGPGYYEANINTVKDKIVSYDMGKSPDRRTHNESPDRSQNIGPGTYDNDYKKIGTDTQKITIRGRPKDQSSNDNPGPGYYEVNVNAVKDKVVGYDMGRSPDRRTHNESPDRNQNIGPGSYDNDYKKIGTDTQKITIRGRPKDQSQNNNPGPGYYEANINTVKDKIVSYDMGKSPDRRTHNESPDRSQNIGPGTYDNDYKKIGTDNQKITIRGRPKDQSPNDNPGPGYYQDNINAIKDKIISYDMGKSSEKIRMNISQDRDQSPGPGFYESDHKKIGIDSQKITIRGRPKEQSQNNNPGPGYYEVNVNLVKDKVVSYDMGRSPDKKSFNESPDRNQNIGPGTYDNDYKKIGTDSQKITIRGRPKDQSENNNPGPGHYQDNINTVKDKIITYDMGKSSEKNRMNISQDRDQSPGPGFYESDYKKIGTDSQKITIKGRPKDQNENNNPGPGYYEVNANVVKDKVVSYDMGRSQGKKSFNESPDRNQNIGPGTYDNDYKKIGTDSQKITIKGRPKDQSENNNPGPGHYETNVNAIRDKVVSYNMGKSTNQRALNESQDRSQSPGPGFYNNDYKKIGTDSQKVTIKGRPKDQNFNDNPGPGHYQANLSMVKDKVVSYDMGRSPGKSTFSDIKDKDQNPGPGYYESDHKRIGSDSQKVTIRGRPRDQSRNDSPGPGHYETSYNAVKDKVISFDMGKSGDKKQYIGQQNDSQSIPGPGYYESNHNRIGSDSQKVTIRGRPKDLSDNISPGPGHYQANHNAVKDKVVSYDMGRSSEKQSFIQFNDRSGSPGPGYYQSDHKKIGSDSQKVTIRGRPKDNSRNDSPGPGQYEPLHTQTKNKVVGTSFQGGIKRFQNIQKDQSSNLGPGIYDMDQKSISKNSKSFTINGRPTPKKINDVPGPGFYNPSQDKIRSKSPSFKISQKQRESIVDKLLSDQPGPGLYSSSSIFGKSAPSFTIGKKQDNRVNTENPGPGQYEANNTQTKNRIISHKIGGNTERLSIVSRDVSSSPGPGNYDSPSKIGQDSKKFTIGVKREQKLNQSPGPGHYNASDSVSKERVKTVTMNQNTQRMDIVSNSIKELPGPGQYEIIQQQTKSFTFSGKPQEKNNNKFPGPGSYQIEGSPNKDRIISHKMDNKSQRTQIVNKSASNLPGPGSYSNKDKQFGSNSITFTIGGKTENKNMNDSPGPGSYQLFKEKVVSYKISQTQRQDIVNKDSKSALGPGVYEQNHKTIGKESKGFTIGKKQQTPKQLKEGPDPGQYSVSYSQVKTKVQNVDMGGKTNRMSLVSKEQMTSPGPGVYYKQNAFGQDSKSFSMKGKPQDKKLEDNPGPGQYDAKDFLTKNSSIVQSVSKTKRQDMVSKEAKNTPGPGQYSQNKKKFGSESKSFKISERYEVNTRNDSPGPGMYEQHSTIGQGKSFQIGKKEKLHYKNDVPGPGSYSSNISPIRDRIQSAKFDSQTKRQLFKETIQQSTSSQIGPGYYHISEEKSGNSFKFKGKGKDMQDNNIPGPGYYNVNDSQTKQRILSHASFSNSPPRDTSKSISPNRDNQLGPGLYDIRDYNQIVNNSISYSFSKTERTQQVDSHPGPGSYNVPCKIADVPEYIIPNEKRNMQFKYVGK